MSHKLDKKRHKRRVAARLQKVKRRYLSLTQGDSLAPEKALAALKDSATVERAKRLARRLTRRGVAARLAAER